MKSNANLIEDKFPSFLIPRADEVISFYRPNGMDDVLQFRATRRIGGVRKFEVCVAESIDKLQGGDSFWGQMFCKDIKDKLKWMRQQEVVMDENSRVMIGLLIFNGRGSKHVVACQGQIQAGHDIEPDTLEGKQIEILCDLGWLYEDGKWCLSL